MNRVSSRALALVTLLAANAMRSSASVSITTWQADLQHTGANLQETALTPENIGSGRSFGYLFSQPLDGQVYGQPLLAGGIKVDGRMHDIVYVATEHDSVYAFDAGDNLGTNAAPLWHDALLPAGTRPVPQSVVGSSDISVEVGITTTPVIDLTGQTLYVLSKVQTVADGSCQQYLHALDLATGVEKFGGPVLLQPTFAGSASEGKNGVIPFNALREHCRAAMILYQGIVYVSFGSLSDTNPYHGEILGYDGTTLKLAKTFISTPNGESGEGGIWQGAAGPAVDRDGNLFVTVANGLWDQTSSPYTKDTNWGETMLKLPTNTNGALHIDFADTLNWFTPNNWKKLNEGDLDLGSCGLLLLPDQTTGPHRHLMVGGGKGGVLYVVDRDNLGGIHTPDDVVQEISELDGDWLFATPAYYNGNIYYAPAGGPLEQRAVKYDAAEGNYIATTPIISATNYGGKGAGVFISANGASDGIAWLLGGAGIEAYAAANVSGAPIYSASATIPPNISCRTAKFSLPVAANGKVYFTATDDTNTGHLFVFGQLSALAAPHTPQTVAAVPLSSRQINITWREPVSNEAGFVVRRATSATGPFQTVGNVGAHVDSFTDSGLRAHTAYYYQVAAFNSRGESPPGPAVTASTFSFFNEKGLVAFWDFDDENSGTVVDVTGNGHNGKVAGEVVASPGILIGAYTFHGTGVAPAHLAVPNSPAFQFTAEQSFTLSAWIKPIHIHDTEQAVIAKSADQGSPYGIWIDTGNRWVFRGPNGDLVGPPAQQDVWTHLAVVQDATAKTRSIYVNGKLAASAPGTQPADGPGDLWMGQQNVASRPESFPGLIDEVRIYNRALDANEIPPLLTAPFGNADPAMRLFLWKRFVYCLPPALREGIVD